MKRSTNWRTFRLGRVPAPTIGQAVTELMAKLAEDGWRIKRLRIWCPGVPQPWAGEMTWWEYQAEVIER